MSKRLNAGFLPLGPRSFEYDESITSWLDRAASLHGLTRDVLVSIVALEDQRLPKCSDGFYDDINRESYEDLDFSIPDDWCRRLEAAAGMIPGTLTPGKLPPSALFLFPYARHAYCPLCFEEDRTKGHLPYFRSEWSFVCITHCKSHLCPLFMWELPEENEHVRLLPEPWCDEVCSVPENSSENEDPRSPPSQSKHEYQFHRRAKSWAVMSILPRDQIDSLDYSQISLDLQRWARYVVFERELNASEPPTKSILRVMGNASQLSFVRDLYVLHATMLSKCYPPRIGRSGWHDSLFEEWQSYGFYGDSKLLQIKDWRSHGRPGKRRTVLRIIESSLEQYFSSVGLWAGSERDPREDPLLVLELAEACGAVLDFVRQRMQEWPPVFVNSLSANYGSVVGANSSSSRMRVAPRRLLPFEYPNTGINVRKLIENARPNFLGDI